MTWGGLEEAVCREYGIFLKWGMWKRWLFSCQEKFLGMGRALLSSVPPCGNVMLLNSPVWFFFLHGSGPVFFRFFLPRPFRFFAKNREKHRRLLKIGLQS